MRDNEDNVNKGAGGSAFKKELRSDLEHNMEKFNDPVVLGELVYRLLEERENTNRILKNILAKLDSLEAKGVSVPEVKEEIKEVLLPKIDEDIMKYIQKTGKVTAEMVRTRFKYKGKNAASARLNKLVGLGLLQKKQVGKKVFFFPTSH